MRIHAVFAVLLPAGLLPAQSFVAPVFPTPSYFRDHFARPPARVELQPPVRFEDFIVNGALELSLRHYLELVMANNTEIQIQRLTLETPRNAILRAFGSFDPSLSASFNNTRSRSATTSALQGAALLSQLNQVADFRYTQRLESGTTFNVGFNGTKAASNDQFSTFNPALNATLTFGFSQPLLRDRSPALVRLPIMVARSQLRRSEYELRNQLMRLIEQAELAYWNVIESRERLRVQEEFLKLREAALKRSQRELELGALSPLEIYRPQQEYATAEIQVTQFRYQLAQREDALRRQMGADLDPEIRKLPIVLTETVAPVMDRKPLDREALVERALAKRPDLKSTLQSLDIDDLSIRSASNRLKPDLRLTGEYSARGRGGWFYERANVFGQSQIVRTVPGGFGDALDQLFGFGLPTYRFGLTLTLPLRDRAAQADLADALVRKKSDSLQARNVEQQIRLEVLNAANQVESAKAGVEQARVALEFAQKDFEAEQKRYDLGVSILYFVLEAQTRLTNAQATLVTQTIAYQRALLNLLRVTGELLDERGIVVNGF
jgi:outer membrane protein